MKCELSFSKYAAFCLVSGTEQPTSKLLLICLICQISSCQLLVDLTLFLLECCLYYHTVLIGSCGVYHLLFVCPQDFCKRYLQCGLMQDEEIQQGGRPGVVADLLPFCCTLAQGKGHFLGICCPLKSSSVARCSRCYGKIDNAAVMTAGHRQHNEAYCACGCWVHS